MTALMAEAATTHWPAAREMTILPAELEILLLELLIIEG